MDKATFKKLTEYCTMDIAQRLYDASEDVKAKFAERFNISARIRPDNSGRGYHVELSANISLEKEGTSYDMVFSPSRGD